MKIFLVRHPQTIANQEKIIYGKRDYPYTQAGEKQIKSILDFFSMKARSDGVKIVTSPAIRAVNLANQIGKLFKQEPSMDEGLGEMNFGIFEGLTLEEAKEKYPLAYDDFLYRFETSSIPEGESYKAFQERIKSFIMSMPEQDEWIFVTHGAVIREMLEQILELKAGDSWKFSINNGTIVELEKKKQGFLVQQIIQPK
jgi:broad specificity phosphatase PhoE